METTPPPPSAPAPAPAPQQPGPLPSQQSPSAANSNAPVPATPPPPAVPIVKLESPETAKVTPETTSTATPPSSALPPAPITIPSHSINPSQSSNIRSSLSTSLSLTPLSFHLAGWFSWTSIHDTERRLLPEFFDGKSKYRTPETYKYIRDSIIRRCWQSPTRRITFTEARRVLVADVGSVRRVFDFLEVWGLINHSPPPPPKQQSLAKPSGPEHEAVVAAAPEKKEVPGKRVCSSCGAVCSQACFTTDKADLVVCTRCFVRGTYRAGLTSGDFKRVDVGDDGGWETKSEWSDKETLHLLEAVYHHGDDWKKVSEHVGNGRTAKDCVIRFLRLPFGEQFMQSEGSRSTGLNFMKDSSYNGVTGEHEGEERESKRMCLSPLLDTSNPIMAQVAFLAAMVGSEVAEATAQAAISSLSDEVGIINNAVERNDETENGGVSDNENERATTREDMENAVSGALLQLEKEQQGREQSITETVQIQMKEMQKKIELFEELEVLMEKEKLQLQYLKSLLFSDQLSLLQHQIRSKPAGS